MSNWDALILQAPWDSVRYESSSYGYAVCYGFDLFFLYITYSVHCSCFNVAGDLRSEGRAKAVGGGQRLPSATILHLSAKGL